MMRIEYKPYYKKVIDMVLNNKSDRVINNHFGFKSDNIVYRIRKRAKELGHIPKDFFRTRYNNDGKTLKHNRKIKPKDYTKGKRAQVISLFWELKTNSEISSIMGLCKSRVGAYIKEAIECGQLPKAYDRQLERRRKIAKKIAPYALDKTYRHAAKKYNMGFRTVQRYVSEYKKEKKAIIKAIVEAETIVFLFDSNYSLKQIIEATQVPKEGIRYVIVKNYDLFVWGELTLRPDCKKKISIWDNFSHNAFRSR